MRGSKASASAASSVSPVVSPGVFDSNHSNCSGGSVGHDDHRASRDGPNNNSRALLSAAAIAGSQCQPAQQPGRRGRKRKVLDVVDPLKEKMDAAMRIKNLKTAQELAQEYKIDVMSPAGAGHTNANDQLLNDRIAGSFVNSTKSHFPKIVCDVDDEAKTKTELMHRFLSSTSANEDEDSQDNSHGGRHQAYDNRYQNDIRYQHHHHQQSPLLHRHHQYDDEDSQHRDGLDRHDNYEHNDHRLPTGPLGPNCSNCVDVNQHFVNSTCSSVSLVNRTVDSESAACSAGSGASVSAVNSLRPPAKVGDAINDEINEILSQLPPLSVESIDWGDSNNNDDVDCAAEENQPIDERIDGHKSDENEVHDNSNDFETELRTVTESDVEKLIDSRWEYVNGTYDNETEWRRWDEMSSAVGFNGEVLHILPYVNADW